MALCQQGSFLFWAKGAARFWLQGSNQPGRRGHPRLGFPTYEEKYQELVELSHSDNPEIKEQADAWLTSIGLQDAAELKVSTFLLDLAIRNVKGEISRDEVTRRINERYAGMPPAEPNALDGGYEIIPPDSPRLKEIEEYNRKLRPALYAELDKKLKKKEP